MAVAARTHSRRKLLLGDWGRVIRDPIDLLRLTFFAGFVVFAVLGEAKAAVVLFMGTVAVVVARLVDLPRLYDLGFCIAIVFTAWGEAVGLYDAWPSYDRVVHFFVPMLSCQVAYIGLARLEVLPDLRDPVAPGVHRDLGLWVVTFALGVAIGGLWEILEFLSDEVFGSNLQEGNTDTVGDLVADSLGAAVGAALLVAWNRFGWGSVRRVPGDNRGEDVSA
jgi:hypothetical protein